METVAESPVVDGDAAGLAAAAAGEPEPSQHHAQVALITRTE
jgi:hypothetical protein